MPPKLIVVILIMSLLVCIKGVFLFLSMLSHLIPNSYTQAFLSVIYDIKETSAK